MPPRASHSHRHSLGCLLPLPDNCPQNFSLRLMTEWVSKFRSLLLLSQTAQLFTTSTVLSFHEMKHSKTVTHTLTFTRKTMKTKTPVAMINVQLHAMTSNKVVCFEWANFPFVVKGEVSSMLLPRVIYSLRNYISYNNDQLEY